MRILGGLITFLFSASLLAQEVSEAQPQVGKHVAANLDVVSILLSLLMVLALIVACAFILRKIQPNRQQLTGMKVVSSLHLGNKEKLVVVEVDDQQLLLGVTAHQITHIKTLEKPIAIGQPLSMDIGQNIVKLLKKNEK